MVPHACFNPRSREGNDVWTGKFKEVIKWFQSTFPRGERHGRRKVPCVLCRFQSTFPRGERHARRSAGLLLCKVSIHVPARGTTGLKTALLNVTTTFQSTFPRGERPRVYKRNTKYWCFNPRSREGNDSEAYGTHPDLMSFNPRSREGNDGSTT